MSTQSRVMCATCAVVLLMVLAGSAQGQQSASLEAGQNMAEMKIVALPGLPTCVTGSVQNGAPSKGPSIILGKMVAGCAIPWHRHTPNENLMMVSGVGKVEMKAATVDVLPRTEHLAPAAE